jgi:hypothetical protein
VKYIKRDVKLNNYLLDWRWGFPALLENAHQELSLETVVLEFMSLGGSDILLKKRKRDR